MVGHGDEGVQRRFPLFHLSYRPAIDGPDGARTRNWRLTVDVVPCGIRRDFGKGRDNECWRDSWPLSYVPAAGFEPASPLRIAPMRRFTRRACHVEDVVPPAFAPALSKYNTVQRGVTATRFGKDRRPSLRPPSWQDVVLPGIRRDAIFIHCATALLLERVFNALPLRCLSAVSNLHFVYDLDPIAGFTIGKACHCIEHCVGKSPTFMISFVSFACVEP